MGAGKTTLIKEMCRQLGAADIVQSPSFTIINEYKTSSGESLFHFDFYRINKPEEAMDIGYQGIFVFRELLFYRVAGENRRFAACRCY